MTTARDIIESALRKIHVLGVGSALSAEEADQALDALNTMIGVWSVENLMIYTETAETFSLSSGVSTYTIGPGGMFNTTRPISIEAAVANFDTNDYRLGIIDQREYSSIVDKNELNNSSVLYFDGNYPLGNIRLWPVPPSTGTLKLYTKKALTEFADLNADFVMPPEYKRALIFNLAIEIAAEYEREPSPTVIRIAAQSKRLIKTQNNKNENHVSSVSIPVAGGYVRIDFTDNEGGGSFDGSFDGSFG